MGSCNREFYSDVPVGLSDEDLALRLMEDLKSPSDDGSSRKGDNYLNDDELSAASGNKWRIRDGRLHFGYRPPASQDLKGTTIRRTSDIPISDRVLTKNGDEILTSNAIRVIKELSSKVESAHMNFIDGAFDTFLELSDGYPSVFLVGDRPFPFYYASEGSNVYGSLVLTVRIHGSGREVNFVRLGGHHDLPQSLRDQVLYLLPNRNDCWCREETKLLPLGWEPPCGIESGSGRNVRIDEFWISTIDRGRNLSMDMSVCGGKLPLSVTVLEVHDGVIETVGLDEDLYHPVVVERAKQIGGRRVEVYRVIPEVRDWYMVSRMVWRRMERYAKLLEKVGGEWPMTMRGLQGCLRLSMIELLVAGMYYDDVRERLPEPKCFLGTPAPPVFCSSDSDSSRSEGHAADDETSSSALVSRETTGPKASPVCPGSNDRSAGVPIELIMSLFYMYVPATKSYYSINRPVDKPVSISSDGYMVHFTECEEPVPVSSTPRGVVAGGLVAVPTAAL